jgi:hypothetical protein
MQSDKQYTDDSSCATKKIQYRVVGTNSRQRRCKAGRCMFGEFRDEARPSGSAQRHPQCAISAI